MKLGNDVFLFYEVAKFILKFAVSIALAVRYRYLKKIKKERKKR